MQEGSGINSILLAQSMAQHAKVCISLNLFAGLNSTRSWSLFYKLLLETCIYVQVGLNVRKELGQGASRVGAFFSKNVKSPISLLQVKKSGENLQCRSILVLVQLLNHCLVLYQIAAELWL